MRLRLKSLFLASLFYMSSCENDSVIVIPEELNTLPNLDIEIIESKYFPDTSFVEKIEIRKYKFDQNHLSEPFSYSWVENSYDKNDSLKRSGFFSQDSEFPTKLVEIYYDPYKNETSYFFNQTGDTIQIEFKSYNIDGITHEKIINYEFEEPNSYTYVYHYVNSRIDSFSSLLEQGDSIILNYAEKRFYNDKNTYDSVRSFNITEEANKTLVFDRSKNDLVFIIDKPSNDTLIIDHYNNGSLFQRKINQWYQKEVLDFDKNGRIKRKNVYSRDTTIHLYKYEVNRKLEFIYGGN